MARRTDLPIMLGKKLKKGILAGPSQGHPFLAGADLYILRLNKEVQSGQRFTDEDIENVEAMIHFCDRESVKRTIDVLTEVLLKWKEEQS